MANITAFGEAMRAIRQAKVLRMIDVAKGMRVSVAYLSAVELGKKKLTDDFLSSVLDYFNRQGVATQELAKAGDRTKTEVDLNNVQPEAREFVAAFARRFENSASSPSLEEYWELMNKSKKS